MRRVLNASVAMLGGQVGLITLRDASGVYRVRATMGVDSARVAEINEQLQQIFDPSGETLDYDTLHAKLSEIATSLDQAAQAAVRAAADLRGRTARPADHLSRLCGDSDARTICRCWKASPIRRRLRVHNAQLYERIDHERRRLAAILQHSADGVMILDAQAQS